MLIRCILTVLVVLYYSIGIYLGAYMVFVAKNLKLVNRHPKLFYVFIFCAGVIVWPWVMLYESKRSNNANSTL